MKTTANAGIDLMGCDFYVTIDLEITHWGCEAKLYGPPENCYPAEAPEWIVHSITLQHDTADGLGPKWVVNPDCAMFDALTGLSAIEYACEEAVSEAASERYWMQRQNRRRRAF